MSKVRIGNHVFETLVAVSSLEQARGLMWAEWPPPIMAFPYKQAGVRKFWMKNTISPLDLIFCCGSKVVGIYRGEPMSTAMIGPDSASDLVVELPFGTANEKGIKVGDEVRMVYSDQDAARIIKEGV